VRGGGRSDPAAHYADAVSRTGDRVAVRRTGPSYGVGFFSWGLGFRPIGATLPRGGAHAPHRSPGAPLLALPVH